MSFCRIDDEPIRTHEPVTQADALIIQDQTLLHQADLLAGLGRDGYMLVNSTRNFRRNRRRDQLISNSLPSGSFIPTA
jgi:pyruvate ferredoxin oxidoreductase gamma subunit